MIDKKQAILETALKLFVENGFHATPTSRIAKEAGVATGTLFHYFKTKEELINSLYLVIKNEMLIQFTESIDRHETIKAKMKQLFLNSINWAISRPSQQMFFMQYSHSPFIDQLTKAKGIQRFSEIFDLLETGKKTEVLKNIPTEMLFEIAEGFINGAINYFKENKEEVTNKDRLEDAFSAFWDGIKG